MSSQTTNETEHWTIDPDQLALLNQLGDAGIGGVEKRLSKLGEHDTTVESEQVHSGYVDERTLGISFDAEMRRGTKVRIPGAPYGNILTLFHESSAKRAAGVMLTDAVEDVTAVSGDMALDALTELGHIMASGFLDSLADGFEQQIDVSTPTSIKGSQRELVESVIRDDGQGLYIAARFWIPTYDIETEVYLFPDNETFLTILDRMDVEMVIR